MPQERRVAENQVLFREINERVRALNESLPPALEPSWICECSNTGCIERVELTAEEYEDVRAHAPRFFVFPAEAHVEAPEVERVVARNERYWVVEKIGDAARIAEARDPRAD